MNAILIEMGPNYEQAVAELGEMGAAIAAACAAGLQKGGRIAAGNVIENYLMGQALKPRTRNLARAVDSWPVTDTDVAIGVRPNSAVDHYKWLLSDEDRTIKPRKKFLAIPIGEGLTGAGVAKFSSPREVNDGFFIRTKSGSLLFGRKNGKRGKFRALFVMVTSVFVQGSGALLDGVLDSLDDISGAMEDEIAKRTGAV